MAKQIITRHKGDIHIESPSSLQREGFPGTTVRVGLWLTEEK